MSYIWQDFNIKTFPSETIVFRDGVFCPELSTIEYPVVDKNYDLPVHYIYVGELVGNNYLDIDILDNVKNQKIYLSVKVKVHSLAKLNISVKNNGMNSELRGFVIIENHGNFDFNIDAHHLSINTGISVKTKLLAHANSKSTLKGTAHIYQYCENAKSDIEMSAMVDRDAHVMFSPIQKISSVPDMAAHSADIAYYTEPQIEYLYEAGLSDIEVKKVLRDAFINNVDF